MKTQNLLFIIISLSFYGTSLFAQDIIVKKDGQEIESKVIEISPVEIKYKIYNNLEGPIYSINKDELVFIRYESGEKETFSYKTKTQNIEDKETKNKYNKIEISNIEHSFHFGAVVPMGDFADDDIFDDDSGFAATGVGIGYEFIYPLTEEGLGLFAGIDLNYNGIQKGVEDDFEDLYEDLYGGYDIEIKDIKLFKYFNIPISAGLNYTYKADDKISLYGNIGFVVNFLKMTDFFIEGRYDYYYDDWVSWDETVKFDIANSFGYKVGGGIIINDNIILSINYLGLGEHKISGEMEERSSDEEDIEDLELTIDVLTLTLGFKF